MAQLAETGGILSACPARSRSEKPDHPEPIIRYVPMGEIIVYRITADDLRRMEEGSPASVFASLTLALLPMGIGTMASVLLAATAITKTFIVLVTLASGCIVAGFVLAVLWYRTARNVRSIFAEIRAKGAAGPPAIGHQGESDPTQRLRMAQYLHTEVDVEGSAVVEVVLHGNAANVMLLDGANFASYRQSRPFTYHGGHYTRSPAIIRPPHPGRWHVVVDLGGAQGHVRASVSVRG